MSEIERKLDAVMRAIAGATTSDRNAAMKEIRTYLESGNTPPEEKRTDVQAEIMAVLLELGVPCNLKGYDYLITAINAVVESPDQIHTVTKGLYCDVAKAHGTTVPRAERGIRHAIEVAWDRLDPDTAEAYFGNTISPLKGKPTNSEFIARIAQIIRRRVGK